jgi:hypothetical protein
VEERSASDREGVGSTPTSGPSVNTGYAHFQLARALATAGEHADEATRRRAVERAGRWMEVVAGMRERKLKIGSRVPVKDTPAWATLEVVTGGFATGRLAAGGSLADHEKSLAARLGITTDKISRLALNRYYLTDAGLAELSDLLERGTYDVTVPEEGALLVIAWLVRNGCADDAWTLLEAISPHFVRLRFYPVPTERPQTFGARVFVRDVRSVVADLRAIEPNRAILIQRETLETWTPFYDELVGLLLETVEGPPPTLVGAGVEGGVAGRGVSSEWRLRADALAAKYERLRREHKLSSKPVRPKSNLAQLIPFMTRLASDPTPLGDGESRRLRELLARYVAKRGVPGSDRMRAVRGRQKLQAGTRLHHEVAAVVAERLRPYPGNGGIEDLEPILRAIADDEAAADSRSRGDLPEAISRRVERCLCETVDVLVRRGLVPSGDVLADVLPQMTSGLRAAGIADDRLRTLYASIYRAFRRRRSLLLLNLESQVRIEELPWVAAIEARQTEKLSAVELNRRALVEVALTALAGFPQAILPNRLVRELRALAKGAEVALSLVDELAADIFMGQFAGNFVLAAKQAGELLEGTLYARYYGIDYREVAGLPVPSKEERPRPAEQDPLAELCRRRAGVTVGGHSPVVNGMIIEQQQILTTQNLAVLVAGLGLAGTPTFQPAVMARTTFDWVVRRLQIRQTKRHARLITIKNSAYAWRQLVFYLSLATANECVDFLGWAEKTLAEQDAAFRDRFRPTLDGLHLAAKEIVPMPTEGGAGPFLGWTQGTHRLLD